MGLLHLHARHVNGQHPGPAANGAGECRILIRTACLIWRGRSGGGQHLPSPAPAASGSGVPLGTAVPVAGASSAQQSDEGSSAQGRNGRAAAAGGGGSGSVISGAGVGSATMAGAEIFALSSPFTGNADFRRGGHALVSPVPTHYTRILTQT